MSKKQYLIKKGVMMKKEFAIFVACVTTFLCSGSDNLQRAYVNKTILPAGYFSSAHNTLVIHSFDNVDFFTVCSGYNGSAVSDYIAKNLHEKLSIPFGFESGKDALVSVFSELETEALSSLQGGSTVVTACIDTSKKILHLAWVGDCRAVLESSGEVMYATEDHVLANKLEQKRIKDSGGVIFRKLTAGTLETGPWMFLGQKMTRVIGDKDVKGIGKESFIFKQPISHKDGQDVYVQLADETVPEIGEFVVKPKEKQIIATPDYQRIHLTSNNRWLILASDRLWNVFSNQEAIDVVTHNANHQPKNIASILLLMASAKGIKDNASAIVIDLLPLFEKK